MTDNFDWSWVDVRGRVKLPETNRITVVLVDLPRDEAPYSPTRPEPNPPANPPRNEPQPGPSGAPAQG